jgi:hypothetical protein
MLHAWIERCNVWVDYRHKQKPRNQKPLKKGSIHLKVRLAYYAL